MFRIESDATGLPADVCGLIDALNQPGERYQEAIDFFSADSDLIVTRSPGRLDVMGGIADYSGSLVLQLPTNESTVVALQRDRSPVLRFLSLGAGPEDQVLRYELAIADLEAAGKPVKYDSARASFAKSQGRHWVAYVAGVFLVLMRERNVKFSDGARILIASTLPQGKGVSSSAAIEVAAMQAVASSFGLRIEPEELALLCQRVENSVVGAPCGIMDQMTAVCGETGKLLALLCQPATLEGTIPIPEGMTVWGLDSGIRHSVAGDQYSSVRVGAFMGYRMIADRAGLSVSPGPVPGQVTIEDPKWGGYLANITPAQFQQHYHGALPDAILGSEFISRYQGTTDSVTSVVPDRTYPVRSATAHPVYEHRRVRTFAELLRGPVDDRCLETLGELMYQSNASYSDCGLGSEGTDLLVDIIKKAGPQSGLYGARVTGGGSGGTVAVLGRSAAGAAVQHVADRYAEVTGHKPHIFRGSSSGASKFGHLTVRAIR
jgi:L-arabinokinase